MCPFGNICDVYIKIKNEQIIRESKVIKSL